MPRSWQTAAGLIASPSAESGQEARRRWRNLTKPEGSLGRLEELAEHLARIRGTPRPKFRTKTIAVFAADHGIAEEGVSAYPRSVTAAMVQNFQRGGAAISVLGRVVGAEVWVVDVGVDSPPETDRTGFFGRKVARGTHNFRREPAMSREEALRSVDTGVDVVNDLCDRGTELLAVGDMGIGNTTSASALLAGMIGVPAVRVTGRGTGVDDSGLARKRAVIEEARERYQLSPNDPWRVMESVGGFEIAAMAGACIAAAARRVPVVLDGFISTTAAVWGVAICPSARDYLIASHRSVEIGHRLALQSLGLEPYFDLALRLGEGTGAALQLLWCDAAVRLLDEMATFEEAEVARKSLP